MGGSGTTITIKSPGMTWPREIKPRTMALSSDPFTKAFQTACNKAAESTKRHMAKVTQPLVSRSPQYQVPYPDQYVK